MTSDFETFAFVALGANQGDAAANVTNAMACLRPFSKTPLRRSSLWSSEPIDCPPGSSPFVNAVVALQPSFEETPETFLEKLQAMEREFGRAPKQIVNEARALDLDLVWFRGELRESTILTLPHPRASQRRFVLAPLAEIASALRLHSKGPTVAELLNGLSDSEQLCTRLD